MTHKEEIQNKSIDELAEWLVKVSMSEDNPWSRWFDNTYCCHCNNVIPITKTNLLGQIHIVECYFCEVNKCCHHFPKLGSIPGELEVCKLWLSQEVKE